MSGVSGIGGGAMSVDRVMALRSQILERNQALSRAGAAGNVAPTETVKPTSFADSMETALKSVNDGLVGEGDDQQLPRPGIAQLEDVGQPRGQDLGLARPGARQHQHRPLGRLDSQPLLGVQPGQIVLNLRHAIQAA